jgi:ABC-type multidrug transport system fused ATPase/permease subunit
MDKKEDFTAFTRVLRYVWPQWTSLTVLLLWSVLIALMFSASILTLIPLLKVMMEEEGLHSWVDRKICNNRYGMDFYVPSRSDYADEKSELTQYLQLTRVNNDKWAEQAGLRRGDQIVNVVRQNESELATVPAEMLEWLANSSSETTLELTVQRTDARGGTEIFAVSESLPAKPVFAGMSQWAISFLPRDGSKETIFRAMILVIVGVTVITILRCLARFNQAYLAEKITSIANARLREDVFRQVMFMPVGFFSSRGTSDTTSRIINDVSMSGRGIKILFGKTLREPMIGIGALVGAFVISWRLTLIFMCSAPLVFGIIAVLGKKMKKATKKSLVTTAHMLGRIQEAMNALRVVKVYNRQQWEIEEYEKTNRSLLKYHLKMSKIDAMTNPLMDALGMVIGGCVILLGAAWVTQQYDGMQPSSFFTLLGCLGIAAESVRKVSDVWNNVQQANAAAERVFAVIDEPKEREERDAFALTPLSRQIEFKGIVFTYPGASQPALKGIDLTVPAGQTVAVVGSNGSGKTTLVNLLPRFYDPDKGQILIDGQDIHKATFASLRDQISMVTQSTVTFNDTIANNIAYSKPDATMDEIIASAQKAYAHEFIVTLPNGYDSVIGELSAGFSGGQLQRIVIARAILKNPKILIFDEAMSQIDADSESKIHKALSGLMKGRTCFLIAHRFSTVISADRIVVVDDGRLIAEGRHDELIQNCAMYRKLYETQLIGGV